MHTSIIKSVLLFLAFIFLSSCQSAQVDGPYFATGIKIGEVTQTEAIVWIRLTENPERIGNDAPMPDVKYKDPKTGKMIERKGRPGKSVV